MLSLQVPVIDLKRVTLAEFISRGNPHFLKARPAAAIRHFYCPGVFSDMIVKFKY